MRYVTTKYDVDLATKTIPKGTVLGIEEQENETDSGLVFILTGEFINCSIHSSHFNELDAQLFTEMNQELLQRREEVKELMDYKKRMEESWIGRQVQVFEKKMLIMEDSQAKRDQEWQKLLDAEREEKELLLKTIENEAAAQKPLVLPWRVAEAIEWFRKQDLSNEEIYDLASEEDDGLYANRIFHWVDGDGSRDELMEALVNGYTVEETNEEERLQTGIKEVYQKWESLPTADNRDENKEREFLAEMITEFVQGFYSKK